jgi:hypothetical protein
MQVLYRLSIYSKIKLEIFHANPSFVQIMRKPLLKGNELEKFLVIQVLSQLCFENSIRNEFKKDKELYEYLDQSKI